MTDVVRRRLTGNGTVAVIIALAVFISALIAPQLVRSEAQPEPATVYRVTYDGVLIGYTDSYEQAERAARLVEEEETLRRGYNVALSGYYAIEPVETSRRLELLDLNSLYMRISEVGRYDVLAVAIMIDEEPVAYLLNEESARNAVERYIQAYREQIVASVSDQTTVEFETIHPVEHIEYVEVAVSVDDIKTTDEAVAFLLQGTDEIVEYEVQSGDSLWKIASRNNMSVSELQAANPHLERPDRLQPGDQLQMTVPKPMISLEIVERRETIEPIPFKTEYKPDPDRWPWEERVLTPGEEGQRRKVERIRRVGNEIIATELLEEEILREPQTQVVARGTKEAPAMGTGEFIWPASGRLTDRFGYSRSRGRTHSGIDIAAPTGTPVYAADRGTVTRAGWYGNYGQTVIIDHGGGSRTTLYAHLSAILVKVGDVVERGQLIGRIGSTGRSTGPHLHFEIRQNGRAVNPMNFFQ